MNINLRITGITSMKDSRICMSGYNMETQMYYRPILPDQHLTNTFLHQPNGDISLFSLVTFEKSNIDVDENPPHIEDFPITGKVIDINNNLINYDEQKTFLRKIADKTIADVFGHYIDVVDNHPVVLLDCGKRSLGTIVSPDCKVYLDQNGNTRVDVKDQTGYQLQNVKCVAFDKEYSNVGQYKNIPVRISLSREWTKPGHSESYYWIQVSGIFP
jgi:hypothetical protein|tara:strand:- start:174 stop:818 length:645 start_codon:yes stop_codon:yes gene_type:complete